MYCYLCVCGGNEMLWLFCRTVVGKAGSYKIQRRPVDVDEEQLCLDRSACHLDESRVGLSNCQHCGAAKW